MRKNVDKTVDTPKNEHNNMILLVKVCFCSPYRHEDVSSVCAFFCVYIIYNHTFINDYEWLTPIYGVSTKLSTNYFRDKRGSGYA